MKLKDLVTAAIMLALLAALGWYFPETTDTPDEIQGRTRVVDGDSLYVDGYEVRLEGIDAPEGRQFCSRDGRDWACGRQSADALRKMIAGNPVSCSVNKRDRHGRLLAICQVRGQNMNLAQVKGGWAVSYGRYKREERDAKSGKRGIWSGTFMRPKEWRDKNF